MSQGGESESGQMVLKKVKWTYFDAYLCQTLWNNAKKSMKRLKRPNSLFLHCVIQQPQYWNAIVMDQWQTFRCISFNGMSFTSSKLQLLRENWVWLLFTGFNSTLLTMIIMLQGRKYKNNFDNYNVGEDEKTHLMTSRVVAVFVFAGPPVSRASTVMM